jgi:multidrug resistance efflux pump
MPKAAQTIRFGAALLVGLAGALTVLYAWRLPPFQSAIETTENAYVRGQVTIIAPQLAGYVTEVPVRDFQRVHAGELLARVDDRIYAQKLLQARATLDIQRANLGNADQSRRSAEARIGAGEAQLEAARSALTTADANARRIESLAGRGISTQSAADQARSGLAQARSAVHQAEASLEVSRQDLQTIIVNRTSLQAATENAEAAIRLAEIDLQNTRIIAPQDGRLGEIGVRLGQYVAAGSQMAALVPERKWVIANFKEGQLHGMRVGQPVSFTVDALPDTILHGQVEAFAPATGSEFSVLRADNATGNFTKVAQRLPVRIAIDADQPQVEQLAPGMSVVVSIDTASGPAARATVSLDPASAVPPPG